MIMNYSDIVTGYDSFPYAFIGSHGRALCGEFETVASGEYKN